MSGPWRTLDEEELAELRRRRAQGWSADDLARVYGVSRRTVFRYLKGEPEGAGFLGRRAVIERWARTYSLDLRPQEVDALVSALAHADALPSSRRAAA
jgi:transcriptional regulator with XRE-family HTH domain